MTRAQLVSAVARTTGESPRTVRRLGFGLLAAPPPAARRLDPYLAVDCPRCRRPCALNPGCVKPGVPAACGRCGVGFGFRPGSVYVAGIA